MTGEAYARTTDPDTSHKAAEWVGEITANALEKQVLEAIRSRPGGLTNHGLVKVTGLDWQTATPRVRPLVRKGLVYDSGERLVYPETNRKCIVWKAVMPAVQQEMKL